MQTNFSKEQLKDKDNKSSEKIFRKCVHCGFCNATCPTYNLLGDELDGPRGRIYLIKELQIVNINTSILEIHQSEIFWNKVKILEFFSNSKNNIIRIVIPPSESVNLIYQFSNRFKYYLDWGGALMWLEAFELSEEMFESIRRKVVKVGGYVTMIKNSDYLPYVEDVFTINKERFNLSQNIKKSFDPKGILNPGKMYTGI